MGELVENRPFPYFVSEANLLRQVKESAAEGLFKSFQVLAGKDIRESSVRFELLLGVYTNAIQFVKFLETGLAVSCLNTEFKDLRRMTDGKIQFKISVPTIAHGDGRRPSKRKQYIVMKVCHKHHISAEIELSLLDLELLNQSVETPLDYVEFVGAVKTVTSALQFSVDALERGLVDSILNVKLRHAPPLFILHSLTDPTFTEGGLKKAVKSDLISMFKSHLLEKSFFLDKAGQFPRARDYVLNMLSELLGAVSEETVFKESSAYVMPNGGDISGVLQTSDNVMRSLLAILGVVSEKISGPASYATYVVRGENLVTAVSYGRAMRSFENFMSRIVEHPTGVPGTGRGALDADAQLDEQGSIPKAEIKASVVRVGNRNVVVESLQRMYNEAQFPFPLNRRMQYSYYFPVGLHLSDPRYTTTGQIRGLESADLQPVETWVVNKNNTVLCFSQQNALKSLCHPRMHNPEPCAQAMLERRPPEPNRYVAYGTALTVTDSVDLYRLMYAYYFGKNQAVSTHLARVSTMTLDELLNPTAHEILELEVHPFFDFYIHRAGGGKYEYAAGHRVMAGNLPEAFAPGPFQESRGRQLEQVTRTAHVLTQATIDIVQETAFDPAYPALCYVVEAVILGQEDKFLANLELIVELIDSYWELSGRLAFVNSYAVMGFIGAHCGNGVINKEAYAHYRRILGEVIALEQALMRLTGNEKIEGEDLAGYVSALMDENLLPPVAYNDIFSGLFENRRVRAPMLRVGNAVIRSSPDLQGLTSIVNSLLEAKQNFPQMFRDRLRRYRDPEARLLLGPRPPSHQLVREKIFYYVVLPVCVNGHACGLGVNFDHLTVALAYNAPAYVEAPGLADDDNLLDHLENGTLRRVVELSEVKMTVRMLRQLVACLPALPNGSSLVRSITARDPTQWASTHEAGHYVSQSVLVNGLLAFAVSERTREALESVFYPLPFTKLYSDPLVAATFHPVIGEYVNQNPTQRDGVHFNVPGYFMAEYGEWHKSPMLNYVKKCTPSPEALGAMAAMHLKLSPVSFIVQARHRVHVGVALTVVRTDEVLAETVLYSGRASTSVFVGRPTVEKREVRADAVVFDVNHELATLDTGLGYSSIVTPARVAAVTTDMGIHCQDLFAVFPSETFQSRAVTDYVKQHAGASQRHAHYRDPRAYLGGGIVPLGGAGVAGGLAHGQLATCEIIPTPVTADLGYFQKPNSPRGRCGCVVTCANYSNECVEELLYNHALPDPVYEFRSTVNPWASQVGSLSDVLYNGCYRQSLNLTAYSPCRAFFNKEDLLRNNRGLFTLVTEYGNRLGATAATSGTDVQYVVISGTDVFLEQPCLLLQEAFPTLSASHRGMLDDFMSYRQTHAPVHMNQFLIEEVAPMKRLFKIGNKVV